MESLASTDWLAANLDAPDLVVLDATAHLPAAGRDARAEFTAGHIPGARFLDLQTFKDPASPVPNALPTAAQFAARMSALGVTPGSRVVLYDDSQVKTSARAWFILRMNGMAEVALLDGGLAKWKAEGRSLDEGAAAAAAGDRPVPRGDWTHVRSKADILANLESRAEQLVDARDAARFSGQAADTVHDLDGGHIPGSRNLPFPVLFNADGTFRSHAELRAAFEAAGIDVERPVVATCGSGVTAAILLFALEHIGQGPGALYDGSWSEWGADPATPRELGPAV